MLDGLHWGMQRRKEIEAKSPKRVTHLIVDFVRVGHSIVHNAQPVPLPDTWTVRGERNEDVHAGINIDDVEGEALLRVAACIQANILSPYVQLPASKVAEGDYRCPTANRIASIFVHS